VGVPDVCPEDRRPARPLTASWGALRRASARITSGRAYQREREQFGLVGRIAAVEVTFSDRHGHHPHLHVVTCHDTPVSAELLEELAGRWDDQDGPPVQLADDVAGVGRWARHRGKDLGSDDLIALPAETWHAVRGCAEQLLTAAEVDGLLGAQLWFSERGLEWSLAGSTTTTRSPQPWVFRRPH
jgi:hypothetical protein